MWNVWYHRHLEPALMTMLDPNANSKNSPNLDTLTALQLMDSAEGKKQALRTLPNAWLETQQLLGENPQNWRWGDLHKTRFRHPLLLLVPEETTKIMEMADYGRGGSSNTTTNTGFSAENFVVRSGASFRMVVDVGNWDAARMTNAPGQSGDPRSRFYDNLLENWANDNELPMLFSRDAVESNRAFRIRLAPK